MKNKIKSTKKYNDSLLKEPSMKSSSRIDRFFKLSKKGPTFVCVALAGTFIQEQ